MDITAQMFKDWDPWKVRGTSRIISTRLSPKNRPTLFNITPQILKAIFQPIPRDHVEFFHITLVGSPGCGKTMQLKWLTERALCHYSPGNISYQWLFKFPLPSPIVNIIPGYRFGSVLDKIDNRPVQLLIIDDAIKHAHSRQGMDKKTIDDIGNFYQVRHMYEDLCQERDAPGLMLIFFATQRYKSLDIVYRDAHVVITKTIPMDPNERSFLRNQIGIEAYRYLERTTKKIYGNHKQTAKSYSIALTSWNQRGIFHSGIPLYDYIPEWIIETEEIAPGSVTKLIPIVGSLPGDWFVFDEATALASIQKGGGEWPLKVWMYQKYKEGVKQADVGILVRDTFQGMTVKDQATVSKYIKELKGELSRILGHSYEAFLKDYYTGLEGVNEVLHGGGKGEPDLAVLYLEPNMLAEIISVKCYTSPRAVKLSGMEIFPEWNAARKIKEEGQPVKLICEFYNTTTRKRIRRELPILYTIDEYDAEGAGYLSFSHK